MHGVGIVHRDIAARNVFVSKGMDAFVADFGLARFVDGPNPPPAQGDDEVSACALRMVSTVVARNLLLLRECSQWLVPVKWTAPEVLRALRKHHVYNPACDVYMYGVLLFEMLSGGRRPWAGHTNAAAIAAVTGGETLAAQLPQFDDKLLCVLREVAIRCWLLDPAARPTMDAIFDELQGARADVAGRPGVGASRSRASVAAPDDDYGSSWGTTAGGDEYGVHGAL